MAKSFIYDSIGFTESTITDGNTSGGTFSSSDTITNESRATDMSISTAITAFGIVNTIRFDLGSSKSADIIALYFSATETSNLTLYAHASSATDAGTSIEVMTSTFTAGWNVFDFSSTSNRYWFLVSTSGSIDNLTEVIIGTKYDFDINFDLNNKLGEEFGTDVITSYGGNEYANKRHNPKTTWSWNWSNISSSMKTSLENVRDSVQDHKKFIYWDETSYHYVRMGKPLEFTEVAYQRYSTNIKLREQLA